jgi:bilirubin oxidase
LIDFQILSRVGTRPVLPYEAEALKDVVWLGGSETVRVIARYAPWDGVYMFHCHNLIHEDHDMMGAFNVSVLQDFGYTEKTKFIDPMEPRWRSKPIVPEDFTDDAIQQKLALFSSLEAYEKVEEVESALAAYWATHKKSASTATQTPTSTSSTSTIVAVSTTASTLVTQVASTTLSSTITTTSKSDDKKSTTTSSKATSTTKK